jgi:hypothetical protein
MIRMVIPLWLKIAYTLFVCVIVPVYWRHYGAANFLWLGKDIVRVWLQVRRKVMVRADDQHRQCHMARP